MERDNSPDATVQVPPMAFDFEDEVEADAVTKLGPVDPDATYVRHDVGPRSVATRAAQLSGDWEDVPLDELTTPRKPAPSFQDDDVVTERVSVSIPVHPSPSMPHRPSTSFRASRPSAGLEAARRRSENIRLAAAAPSAPMSGAERAAEARAMRERLSASYSSTPSGKMTLRPPPLDLSADQTLDPVARVTRPTRMADSLAPRASVAPPPAALASLASDPALRDTARRPLAPPILTQVPAYFQRSAPSSVVPVALSTAPGSTGYPIKTTSRAQSTMIAAMLLVGVFSTTLMGVATFAPSALAKGRAAATVQLDTLLGHPPRSVDTDPPPAPTYEPMPAIAVPPVLADATATPDAGH